MAGPHGLHEAPRRELLPEVTRWVAVLVIGVLLLQLGFVLSYVGAFHAPTPLAVVVPAGAPAGTAQSVVDRLEGPSREPRWTSRSPTPRATPAGSSPTERSTACWCWAPALLTGSWSPVPRAVRSARR